MEVHGMLCVRRDADAAVNPGIQQNAEVVFSSSRCVRFVLALLSQPRSYRKHVGSVLRKPSHAKRASSGSAHGVSYKQKYISKERYIRRINKRAAYQQRTYPKMSREPPGASKKASRAAGASCPQNLQWPQGPPRGPRGFQGLPALSKDNINTSQNKNRKLNNPESTSNSDGNGNRSHSGNRSMKIVLVLVIETVIVMVARAKGCQ